MYWHKFSKQASYCSQVQNLFWKPFSHFLFVKWHCSFFLQSPFPEFKGHFEFEKENSHMTPGNVKASLTFSDVSPKSAPSPPTQSLKAFPTNLLRPGEVLEVQKRLTPQVARQQKCTTENVLKVSHQPNWPEEGEYDRTQPVLFFFKSWSFSRRFYDLLPLSIGLCP